MEAAINPTLLVVDDDRDARQNARDSLEDFGYNAIEADGIDDAVAKVLKWGQRLCGVITDQRMESRFAGDELVRRLSRIDPQLRIGIRTAFLDTEGKDRTERPNVAFYAPKNTGWEELRPKIDNMVQARPYAVRSLQVRNRGEWKPLELVSNSFGTKPASNDSWQVEQSAFNAQVVDDLTPIQTRIRFEFPVPKVRIVKTDDDDIDDDYDYLEIQGNRFSGLPGEPRIPFLVQRVALPIGVTALRARLENPVWIPACEPVRLMPVPEPTLDLGHGAPIYRIDQRAYYRDRFIPDNGLQIMSKSRMIEGVHCAEFKLWPLRYNPLTNLVEVLASGSITIDGIAEKGAGGPSQSVPEPLFAQTILDHSSVEQTLQENPAKTGDRKRQRYLAIGTQSALDALEPLLRHHEGQFDLTRTVLEQDLPGYDRIDPDQRRVQIQRFLKEEASRGGLRYVLLVGGEATVPLWYWDRYKGDGKGETEMPIPSDLRYAGYDREEPWVPPFALGRIPFDDTEALQKYAANCGSSEQSRQWVLLCGQDDADTHPGESYKDLVQEIRQTFYHRPCIANSVTGPVLRTSAPHQTTNITHNLLLSGAGLVLYRGHGMRLAWNLIPKTQLWRVRDSGGSVAGVVSLACCTATPDMPRSKCNPCDGIEDCFARAGNMAEDSLGVAWLKYGRTPWFIGAARKTFRFVNDDMYRILTKQLTDPTSRTIGEAWIRTLDDMLADRRPEVIDNLSMSFLLGDPASPLRHERPH